MIFRQLKASNKYDNIPCY